MDILGMDATWTAEFAEAGWIRELNPRQVAAANQDILQPPIDTAVWKGRQYRHPQAHQRPAAVVPQGPRPDAAEDVRRDDADGPAAR